MTKIKICGLRRPEDIRMANRMKPDYIGFVFAGTKRRVTPEQAEALRQKLCPEIQSVGVFVNEKIGQIEKLANAGILDLIQLHGDENADYIRELRRRTDCPLIKAVRVRRQEDILEAQELDTEYLLLDTYREGEPGGSGETFSWDMIPRLTKPYFLAGGLDARNVRQAIDSYNPWAVDVSSRVETDGWKDAKKVEEFIKQVRGK